MEGFLQKLTAILLSFFVAVTGLSASVINLTEGTPIQATQRDYCFDNDGLILGGYSCGGAYLDEEHVKYAKEAGLDFLVSPATKDFLDLCMKYGIGVIAERYNINGLSSCKTITSDNYKDHPALWGDSIIDEPATTQFGDISEALKNYYSNISGKFPLVNLYPMSANEQQLQETAEDFLAEAVDKYIPVGSKLTDFAFGSWDYKKFGEYGIFKDGVCKARELTDTFATKYRKHISNYINTVDTDYISFDIYPVVKGPDIALGYLRNLDIMSEACRETGRDLWIITQAAGNEVNGVGGDSSKYCDTPEDIRIQMYCSLAFGAKAVIHACYSAGWWDGDSHMIDDSGNRTDTYYAVQKVNKEVSVFAKEYGKYKNIGAFLVHNEKSAGEWSGYLNPLSEDGKVKVVSNDPILVGCFKGDTGRAYSIVNMNCENGYVSSSYNAKFDGAKKITVYRKGEVFNISGNKLSMTLEGGEGVFVTVE